MSAPKGKVIITCAVTGAIHTPTTSPYLDIAFVTSMARPHNNTYHREPEAGCVFAVHGLTGDTR